MYLLILILPLLGSLLAVNRKCGHSVGPRLSTLAMALVAIFSTIAFFEVGLGGSDVYLKGGYWIETLNFVVEWSLVFDTLTVSMLLPIAYISTMVLLYSLSYMGNDPHISRFFSYLSLFTFFMLVLVTSENLLVLFIGWEGIGVVSWLLINFWFTRIAANMAAMKAFLINRLGDYGLALGILVLIGTIGGTSFAHAFSLAAYLNGDMLLILTILLLVGSMAKSAQIGLGFWLAASMEGPTPVSALLHSATMVTAGVFLLMRFSPLIEYCSTGLIIITWLGGLSALFGAAAGLLENDLKRIIAYSTTSQLGYMIAAIGLSQHSVALFHLINHSFFKALLFLSAGSVIHALSDQQDIRRMGSLVLFLPQTYSATLIGSLSLMAFPFMTGFYSKDFLLELAMIPRNATSTMAYILTLAAAVLTATYTARSLIQTFMAGPAFMARDAGGQRPILDSDGLIILPLALLGLGATVFGYLAHELFLGLGSSFYGTSLFTHPNHLALLDGSLTPIPDALGGLLKYLPLATLLILFTLVPLTIPRFGRPGTLNATVAGGPGKVINSDSRRPASPWISLLADGLRSFNLYNHWIMHHSLNTASILNRYIDRGLLEVLGPTGLLRFFHFAAFRLELLATGFIIHYAFIILFTLFLAVVLFSTGASSDAGVLLAGATMVAKGPGEIKPEYAYRDLIIDVWVHRGKVPLHVVLGLKAWDLGWFMPIAACHAQGCICSFADIQLVLSKMYAESNCADLIYCSTLPYTPRLFQSSPIIYDSTKVDIGMFTSLPLQWHLIKSLAMAEVMGYKSASPVTIIALPLS